MRATCDLRRSLLRLLMAAVLGIAAPSAWADDADAIAADELLGGFRGRWLRTDRAEVFIAVEPMVRVLAFRRPSGASLMADDTGAGEVGVRLAFMEPIQIPASFGPGNQPGRFTAATDASATVLAQRDDASGLQLELSAHLAPESPALHLTYRLHNRSDAARRIAIWSVTALPRDGAIVVPFGDQPRSLRRLVYSWWTTLPQAGLQFGRDALRVDFASPLAGSAFKVGVTTEAGWVAAVRDDGRALLSTVRYRAGATYPEGGANITVFQFAGEKRRWCEFEQVGPLTTVDSGGAATMSETLTLLRLAAPASSTPSPPIESEADAEADPDAWRTAIEHAITDK